MRLIVILHSTIKVVKFAINITAKRVIQNLNRTRKESKRSEAKRSEEKRRAEQSRAERQEKREEKGRGRSRREGKRKNISVQKKI